MSIVTVALNGNGVPVYSTIGSFPNGAFIGQLAVAADTGALYEWNGSGWQSVGGGGGGGTVNSFSFVGANGFTGTVANSTTTPALTLKVGVTGIIKGDGTAISAAVAGSDYLSPTLTSAHVLVGNGSNVATDVAASGDVTLANTGAFTIAKIQGTTVSGTTGSGNVAFSSAPTLANPVVGTQSQGDSSTKAASTAYVDTAVSNAIAGVNPAVAVQAATTAASDTSSFTYSNGASGIGATLTGPVNTALTVDGYTFTAIGQRLLVKNDTQSPSGAYNGVYYVTQVQTAILPLILTRALDYDMPSDINNTGAIPVINGTVNGTTSWVLTSQVTTVGTDPLTFVEFTRNPADYLLKTNNLSDVSNARTSFNNIMPMTTAGDLEYYSLIAGGATRLPVGTINQVMTVSSSLIPKWQNAYIGVSLPIAGDTVYEALGAVGFTRLPVGTANQIMVVSTSLIPVWQNAYVGVSLPVAGDIVYEALGAVGFTRLPVGGTASVLAISSSLVPFWDTQTNVVGIPFLICDGISTIISTGIKGDIEIPFNCMINRVTLVSGQTCALVVDIYRQTYANFPPTNTQSITASAKPTLNGEIKYQDSTLTSWTLIINAGDLLRYNVDSCSLAIRATCELKGTKF